jgi:hypothetical protein
MAALREALRREPLLPYGELGALRRPVLRATAFRLALAAAVVGVLVTALVVALGRDARPDALLPAGTTGMIVLDLSASTGAQTEVGELFRRIAAANEPTGVAVFSDGAYELVPPGTPGRDLAPMVRFFSEGPGGTVPRDPWSEHFSGGTRVTAGIEQAQASFERDKIARGSILLVSDLEFVAEEIARLPALLAELRRDGIELRILPVEARDEQKRFFERVVGPEVFVDVEAGVGTATGSGRDVLRLAEDETPWLFVGLAAVLILLLGANERLCGRLRLPVPGDRSG